MKNFLALLLIVPTFASASEFNTNARGTTTAGFLKLGVGARAAAMGEAQTAASEGAESLYWNPAGLANIESCSATFMHAAYIESSSYDYGAYAHKLKGDKGVVALGVQYFSAGSLTGTDTTGTETGSFTPNDLAVSVGYAREIGLGGSVGASVKYIQSKIVSTAKTAAFDVGWRSLTYGGKITYGAAVTNLGGKMKFDEAKESLPTAVKLGVSYHETANWLTSIDLLLPNDNKPGYALGTEYRYKVKEQSTLTGRLGYNSRNSGDQNGLVGIAFGLGFGFKKYSLDYAMVPFGDLGNTHRISLSAKF